MFSARVQKSLPVITDPKLAVWRSFLAPLVKRALPPPTPRNFQATNVRGGIQISWSPLQRPQVGRPGPDGYELLRSVDGSFTGDVQVLPINNHQQTSFFDPFGTPTTVHYRIRATSGTVNNPQSLRGPESGVIRHTSLDPSDNSSRPTTRHDNYTNEKVSSMARFGNYGLEVYQGSSTVQSAPSSSSNSGGSTPSSPGAPVPSGTAVSFGTVTGGTNTNNDLQVGDGSTIEAVNTGVINATEVNGVPITGSAASANLVPITVGNGSAAWGAITETQLVLSDVTTDNVSTTKHGFAPKAPNVVTKFLDGTGAFTTPTLAGDSDVQITTPADKDILSYKAADSKFENQPAGTLGLEQTANKNINSGYAGLSATGTLSSSQMFPHFVVASLPAGAEGNFAYATNGRKVGEGAGLGTGVPVYFSSSQWRVYSTDAQVLA